MAFRTDDQLARTFERSRAIARSVRNSASSVKNGTAAGDYPARQIVGLMDDLQKSDDDLASLSATSGIVQYAKDQYSDSTYEIGPEFNAMRAAIASAITWIDTNVPKSGGRWIEVEEIVNGRILARTLSSSATSGLRTELDALIATISI